MQSPSSIFTYTIMCSYHCLEPPHVQWENPREGGGDHWAIWEPETANDRSTRATTTYTKTTGTTTETHTQHLWRPITVEHKNNNKIAIKSRGRYHIRIWRYGNLSRTHIPGSGHETRESRRHDTPWGVVMSTCAIAPVRLSLNIISMSWDVTNDGWEFELQYRETNEKRRLSANSTLKKTFVSTRPYLAHFLSSLPRFLDVSEPTNSQYLRWTRRSHRWKSSIDMDNGPIRK